MEVLVEGNLSMCNTSSISADKETVKKWFNQKIPFLNDKIPADIIRNEDKGEEMIYNLLMSIRYGGAS